MLLNQLIDTSLPAGGGNLPPFRLYETGRNAAWSNVRSRIHASRVTMIKKLLFVTTLLLVIAFVAVAADVTGKWTYEQAGRQGGPARQVTITLKQDGSNLTGTVPGGMGRGGGGGGGTPPPEVAITNGKVDGDKVSFEVKREFQGNAMVTKYEGTVSGSEMKLKITRPGRDGESTTTEVTAKKSTT
jgi:hypothetical protein